MTLPSSLASVRCSFADGRCVVCGEPESGMCNGGEPSPASVSAQTTAHALREAATVLDEPYHHAAVAQTLMAAADELDTLTRERDEAREQLRVERLAAVLTSRDYVQRLAASETARRAAEQAREKYRLDAVYHSECRPNRLQAEAAMADAKAMNDKWADEVKARRDAETALTEARTSLLDQVLAIVDQRLDDGPLYQRLRDELAALRHSERTP